VRQTFFKAAELKVSYKCNRGCRFCWVGDRRGVTDLSLETQLANLQYITDDPNIEAIHISGGEPTIRKELLELLERVKQRKFKAVIMHTNGLAFDHDEYAQQVIPYLTHAVISLQAGSPERHEYILASGENLRRS
jgi:molybdenum cofactor biosynthesis enzyme MoaA